MLPDRFPAPEGFSAIVTRSSAGRFLDAERSTQWRQRHAVLEEVTVVTHDLQVIHVAARQPGTMSDGFKYAQDTFTEGTNHRQFFRQSRPGRARAHSVGLFVG